MLRLLLLLCIIEPSSCGVIVPAHLLPLLDELIIIMSGKIIVDAALRAAVNVRSSTIPSAIAKTSSALLSSLASTPAKLPDLAYDYNALERESIHGLSSVCYMRSFISDSSLLHTFL